MEAGTGLWAGPGHMGGAVMGQARTGAGPWAGPGGGAWGWLRCAGWGWTGAGPGAGAGRRGKGGSSLFSWAPSGVRAPPAARGGKYRARPAMEGAGPVVLEPERGGAAGPVLERGLCGPGPGPASSQRGAHSLSLHLLLPPAWPYLYLQTQEAAPPDGLPGSAGRGPGLASGIRAVGGSPKVTQQPEAWAPPEPDSRLCSRAPDLFLEIHPRLFPHSGILDLLAGWRFAALGK